MDDGSHNNRTTHSSQCICSTSEEARAVQSRLAEVAEDAKAEAAGSLIRRIVAHRDHFQSRAKAANELVGLASFSLSLPDCERRVLQNLLEATLAHI